MSLPRRALTLAGLLAAGAALADDAWILSAGGEADDHSGYRLDAGAIWLASPATAVTVLVGRSDSSTDFGDFVSTVGLASFDHHFDPLGLTLEGRLRRDSEFLDAQTLAASLYYKRGPWRLALEAETRATDFEPQTFQNVFIPRSTGTPVEVSATSQCGLDNTGFGVIASYSGRVWNTAVSGRQYHYSDADCELTNLTPASLGRFLQLRPDLLQLIAPRLAAFQRLQRSSVTRESTFLESTYSLSLGFREGGRSWDFDYYHDREQFAGLQSDTLAVALTLPMGPRSDVELRVGATDGDVGGVVGFAGVTFYVYVGGGS